MQSATRLSKFSLWLTLFAFAFMVVTANAQNSQGTILGHVQDSTGAGLPGVKVTATNVGTNVSAHFTTNSMW